MGDDSNDLPCHEWQDDLNSSLLGLLHPAGNNCPKLLPGTVLTQAELQTPKYLKPLDSFLIKQEDALKCESLRLAGTPTESADMCSAPEPVIAEPPSGSRAGSADLRARLAPVR